MRVKRSACRERTEIGVLFVSLHANYDIRRGCISCVQERQWKSLTRQDFEPVHPNFPMEIRETSHLHECVVLGASTPDRVARAMFARQPRWSKEGQRTAAGPLRSRLLRCGATLPCDGGFLRGLRSSDTSRRDGRSSGHATPAITAVVDRLPLSRWSLQNGTAEYRLRRRRNRCLRRYRVCRRDPS